MSDEYIKKITEKEADKLINKINKLIYIAVAFIIIINIIMCILFLC